MNLALNHSGLNPTERSENPTFNRLRYWKVLSYSYPPPPPRKRVVISELIEPHHQPKASPEYITEEVIETEIFVCSLGVQKI
jgi:hypothetical protein